MVGVYFGAMGECVKRGEDRNQEVLNYKQGFRILPSLLLHTYTHIGGSP